jgi:hypothetical protein
MVPGKDRGQGLPAGVSEYQEFETTLSCLPGPVPVNATAGHTGPPAQVPFGDRAPLGDDPRHVPLAERVDQQAHPRSA